MKRRLLATRAFHLFLPVLIIVAALPLLGAASADDPIAGVLLTLVILLPSAKVGGWIAEKLRQPAVLGELLAGMVIGNLGLAGVHGLEYLKTDAALEVLAGLGVVLLLFEIGLESSLASLMKVGLSSFLVASIGVALPFALGWAVSAALLPGHSYYVHAFVGATLCATSVGITARVLRDIGRVQSREAKVILGAAVIDDVLGLIILAIVTGMVTAAAAGETFTTGSVLWLIAKVVVFLAGALAAGLFLVPRVLRQAAKAQTEGMLFAVSLTFCFLLAYISALIGLAPIVGAFAAGLILEGMPWGEYISEGEHSLEDFIHPVSAFLVPLFFVQMGLKMDVTWLARLDVLGLASALTVVAIIGKQVCGLAVVERGLNRLAIGVGMIPRGEVGLIFAGVGLNLSVGGERIVDEATFAAILVMVMLTTIISPPLLQWSFRRPRGAETANFPK
ncbi:MAG TPA: cation:proton antiporter [Candidatus Binatia bacterium]|jgi:Kef-type K+ transport system membrane component KefB